MYLQELLIGSVNRRGIWQKNFKGLHLSINQCDLHNGGCLRGIMDTLYADIFHLVKKFCTGGRTSSFCHCVSLALGT